MSSTSEFVYRIPGEPGSSRPGAHRSRARGPGLTFSGFVRLIDQPDPRRLDLRASICSVNRDWLVRATRQTSATLVQVVVDVSASMQFGSPKSKLEVVADFIESLGRSAFTYGDALGMLAFDEHPREELLIPARTSRSAGTLMAETLRQLKPSTHSDPPTAMQARTLINSFTQLDPRSKLIFLVSDFHWPLDYLHDALNQLSPIALVPIVLWDQGETTPPQAGHWLRTRDMESGKQRALIMRPATIRQWQENIKQRRKQIRTALSDRGITPLFMENGFQAENVSRYFMENTL